MHRTRYGETNPERVEDALWEQAIRNKWDGWQTRQYLNMRNATKKDIPSHSTYRNSTPGPFWSWNRFGRTSTRLDDGRIIHVGGEHEDFYDDNFCIYNDVVVENLDGSFDFYLYPVEIFPPTDFHSATLYKSSIVLIGSTGYKDMRQFGATQVLQLDIWTFRIDRLHITGDGPGWISRHSAKLESESVIVLHDGQVLTKHGRFEQNNQALYLDLRHHSWANLSG